jgi:hypothetical protein
MIFPLNTNPQENNLDFSFTRDVNDTVDTIIYSVIKKPLEFLKFNWGFSLE